MNSELRSAVGRIKAPAAVKARAAARADVKMRLSVTADVIVSGRRTFRNLAEVTEPAPSRDQVAIRVVHVREFSRELPERVADVGH